MTFIACFIEKICYHNSNKTVSSIVEFFVFSEQTYLTKYGYSIRGHTASGIYVSPHGPRLSVIAAISFDGVLAASVSEENLMLAYS